MIAPKAFTALAHQYHKKFFLRKPKMTFLKLVFSNPLCRSLEFFPFTSNGIHSFVNAKTFLQKITLISFSTCPHKMHPWLAQIQLTWHLLNGPDTYLTDGPMNKYVLQPWMFQALIPPGKFGTAVCSKEYYQRSRQCGTPVIDGINFFFWYNVKHLLALVSCS